jgi:toxin YoeB
VSWKLVYTKQAKKDSKKVINAGIKDKTEKLLQIIKENPYQNPHCYSTIRRLENI